MREHDYDEFAGLLGDVWALKGQALTGGQKAIFFRALAAHPINEVRAGLDAHIRDPKRGQFLPMPADVIAQIQGIVADDGRPGAEEAWAGAFRATDEAATVVWTEEAAEAFGVARPLLLAGDEVGARMAFKETYNRLLGVARDARKPARWSVTLGFDNEQRDATLLPHVKAGRVPADLMLGNAPALRGIEGLLALPAPEPDEAIENEEARAAAHARTMAAREVALKRIAEIRAEDAAKAGASIDEAARARTAALKNESAAKVAAYTPEAR